MNIKKDILWRAYLTFFLVGMLGVLVVWKAASIQLKEGDYWGAMADSLTTTYVNIESTRGNIYSEDGSLLATSLPIYEIRLDLNTQALTDEIFYNNIDSLSQCLSNFFGDKSTYQYKRLLTRKRKEGARYFLLKRNINHNELKKLKEFPLFRRGRYKGGFIAKQKSKRIKPFGQLAARTIGYKVPNVTGVGLEGAYNNYLKGESGKRLMQKVQNGEWIPINNRNELEPKDGKDVISTIDVNIQDATESALRQSLKNNDAAHGCAVVMEVETGEVKAIANLEKNKDGSYTENYNYAVGESLEPGSTFKLASALILLEKGLISPMDSIETGDGEHEFYDRTMQDASSEGYGTITFKRAMEISSNVAFSKTVFNQFKDHPKRYTNALKDLHLNKRLGLPISGEGKPVIKEPNDEDWSGITLPWMAIGYEVRLTPLQLLTFYNGIANNGKMVKPRFAKEVREVGKEVKSFGPQVIDHQLCSQNTIQQLKDMLEGVVEDGTAKNLHTKDYPIAGKTGTVQIAAQSGYDPLNKDYQASFVGFFPKENPKYSCIVVVNKPTNDVYYGSWVAGPVFRQISDQIYANNLQMHDEYPKKVSDSQMHVPPFSNAHATDIKAMCQNLGLPFEKKEELIDWVQPQTTNNTIKLSNKELGKNKIPDVRGMVLSDALYVLENRGMEVKSKGTGRVSSQSIMPGTNTNAYDQITLKLR